LTLSDPDTWVQSPWKIAKLCDLVVVACVETSITVRAGLARVFPTKRKQSQTVSQFTGQLGAYWTGVPNDFNAIHPFWRLAIELPMGTRNRILGSA
jgi:hypothetical protein